MSGKQMFFGNQEVLLTMEEEPIYENPDALSRQKNQSPLFKTNTARVNLHHDFSLLAPEKKWKSTRNLEPSSPDGRHNMKQNKLGASMSNLKGSTRERSTSVVNSKMIRQNAEYISVSDHKEEPHRNSSRVDSCCNCCCFLLLYLFITAVAVGYFVLHVHYPQLLDPNRPVIQLQLDVLKKEYGLMRRFLKAYCNDYIKTENQTLVNFAKLCKLKFPEKVVGSVDEDMDD